MSDRKRIQGLPETPQSTGSRGGGHCGGGIHTLVDLVVSFGICGGANIVSHTSNTSRDFVEGRRHGRHGRDAYGGARVWARRAAADPPRVVDADSAHVSIARAHQITAKGVSYTP